MGWLIVYYLLKNLGIIICRVLYFLLLISLLASQQPLGGFSKTLSQTTIVSNISSVNKEYFIFGLWYKNKFFFSYSPGKALCLVDSLSLEADHL